MKNRNNPEDHYDYSPNELANMPKDESDKIIKSNLDSSENIEDWEQSNWNYMNHNGSKAKCSR